MPGEALLQSDAFQMVLTVAGFLAAFVLKSLWRQVQEQRQEMASFREHVAREYVTKNDITQQHHDVVQRLSEIRDHVTRVEDKLDRKQDKPNG